MSTGLNTRARTIRSFTVLVLVAAILPIMRSAEAAPECSGHRATIKGTHGADTIAGTPGPDIIVGRGGDDTITGGKGTDIICGGQGNDQIDLGAGGGRARGALGDDRLTGGAGIDVLRGEEGDDSVVDHDGYSGHDFEDSDPVEYVDTIRGGEGSDSISTLYGQDEIDAGGGEDGCLVGGDVSPLSCEDIHRIITIWNSVPYRSGTPECRDHTPNLIGTEDRDRIVGSAAQDHIVGLGGNDTIEGSASWGSNDEGDVICGGPGDDDIAGHSGADLLSGDEGNDSIDGNDGRDVGHGGPGDDRFEDFEEDYRSGTDVYIMGPGNDVVRVKDGDDSIFGGQGDDTMSEGMCGQITFDAGPGDDYINAYPYDRDEDPGSPCGDPIDDVLGGEGFDTAEVDSNDRVDSVENLIVEPPQD